jgi:hypothetical protein
MYDNPFMINEANTSGSIFIINFFHRVRKLILGASFVEGTWVGYALDSDQGIYYVVETYEQTLTQVSVEGVGLTEAGKVLVRWSSKAIEIRSKTHTLGQVSSYYDVSSGSSADVIGCFVLLREGAQQAPKRKEGFVVEVAGLNRHLLIEEKVSDKLLDPQEALASARALYRRSRLVGGTPT